MAVTLPFAELERARADDVEFARGLVLLFCRDDREGIDGAFQRVEKRCIHLLEMNDEGVIIRGFIMVDNVENLGVRAHFCIALEAREHVVRFHVGAVMKFDALAQLEGQRLAVFAEDIAFSEHCRGIIISVDCDQALIDLMGDFQFHQRVAHMRVQCAGAGIAGINQCAAFFRRFRQRGGCEQRRRQQDGIEQGANCHDFLPDFCVKMAA
ncbi:Uncharacterised protein [Brucella suis]|nr:Uncharacterised protein [Brucella suis]